jgi:hypothetical protein
MTYPLSADVTAGQPTAAAHYNNLRADALRLGQALADSANLGDMLARWEAANLTITILGTDRLRVPCSSIAPVSLIVNGFILRSISNVDLSAGGKPSGSPATWYVFACRTVGSSSFTILVNSSATEGTDQRLIGSFYWDGAAIQSPTIRTVFAGLISTLINHVPFVGCQGRLSFFNTGPSFGDGNCSGLYLVPYKGNQISLFNPGFGWTTYSIPTVASAPALYFNSLNTAKCYDVFAYWDGAAVQLTNLAWTNLITRATPLTYQDGVYVLSTDPTRLYLGTFTPYNTSLVNDYPGERGLWNYFNRVQKAVKRFDTTASWTYNAVAWEVERAQTNPILVTKGIVEDTDQFDVACMLACTASHWGIVGIGVDSLTVNSADIILAQLVASLKAVASASLETQLAVGNHSIYWLEACDSTTAITFYGQPVAGYSQSGLTGLVWC